MLRSPPGSRSARAASPFTTTAAPATAASTATVDRPGVHDPVDRHRHDRDRDEGEHDGVEQGGQDRGPVVAEGALLVPRPSGPAEGGEGGPQGHHVGQVVAGVRQQHRGVPEQAGDEFPADQAERQREGDPQPDLARHRLTGAPLGALARPARAARPARSGRARRPAPGRGRRGGSPRRTGCRSGGRRSSEGARAGR